MEGRVNLVFEELAKSQTKVTVTTKYVVTLEGDSKAVGYQYGQPYRYIMNFNTNSKGFFPSGTTCISKGELEREILDLIK